jgi:hypothetical protein
MKTDFELEASLRFKLIFKLVGQVSNFITSEENDLIETF